MTSTTPLDVKSVVYGDDTKTGCPYDYVRIPGGSEDGNTHTARERYCGQALGFCRVQVRDLSSLVASPVDVTSHTFIFFVSETDVIRSARLWTAPPPWGR